MTANVHSVNLGAGVIFSLQITGLSIAEADFLKSFANTVTRDQIELPQHSSHEVILDAAMQLCDKFGKDDPEYTTAAVRLAALALRIATEGDEAFDRGIRRDV
ncbi:MAG: hypothetical protein J0L53_18795 [Spirochaetes bacterium]|nr:hypothetical protein [Spirochaetota bacterium]